jgi:hypothetical protein
MWLYSTGHTGLCQKPCERGIAVRHEARVLQEVAQGKKRFGLPESASVVHGDEAGRDGQDHGTGRGVPVEGKWNIL